MTNNDDIKLTGYIVDEGIKSYIKNRLDKYKLLKRTFIGKTSGWESFKIFVDFSLSVIILGSGINDYFQYNFYKKPYSERKKFIVGRTWKEIIKDCNGSLNVDLFDDKIKFNTKFNKFLKRDWLDIDKSSYDEFSQFISDHAHFFVKKNKGSGGNGIEKYEDTDIKDKRNFYENLHGKSYIIEESIIQNKELSDFNPTSVNTIRVVTIKTNTDVKIMDAVLRMGNGNKSTDNFHKHGLAMKVDVSSGEVVSKAIDKSNNHYEYHPLSKKKLIGFKIPNWNKVIETVKEAAKVSNQTRYVGWDIAILDNGEVSIIEGNCSSDPDITQMPLQIGRYEEYRKVINTIDN